MCTLLARNQTNNGQSKHISGLWGASTGQATMTARTAFCKIDLWKEVLFSSRVWLDDLYVKYTFDAITGIYISPPPKKNKQKSDTRDYSRQTSDTSQGSEAALSNPARTRWVTSRSPVTRMIKDYCVLRDYNHKLYKWEWLQTLLATSETYL